DGFCTEDVVLDCLAGIALHHRHVLVRRAVEDDVWLDSLEHLSDARAIADIGDDRHDLRADPALDQLALNLKKAVLGAVEQHEFAGAELHALPADFRADAAAGTGHQHYFSGDEALK